MSRDRIQLNVLLINNYFPPETGAASHLYYYLSKELLNRGHKVRVLTGIPRYNVNEEVYKSYLKRFEKRGVLLENQDGIEIIRVKLPLVDRKKFLRRGLEHFQIAYMLYKKSRSLLGKVDVSLVYSPPLTLYWTALKIRKNLGAPFVLNIQDLFPQAAIDLGIMKNKLLISFFRNLEKKAYEAADLITVHSEGNADFVVKTIGSAEKVLVIENWIDDREILPGPKENAFAFKHGLRNKFVVSFAGTLGLSQDVEVIIRAANELRGNHDIVFLIVGDGVRREQLLKMVQEYNLQNVVLLPPVSRDEYPLVLHSSDVSLATLTKDVKTPVVPSKILSIMSAGIPVVASMDLNGDGSKLIKKARCGFVVEAGEYVKLAEAILKLYKDPKLREEFGKNGRRYVEEHLSVRKAAEKYEKIFYNLVEERRKTNGLPGLLQR